MPKCLRCGAGAEWLEGASYEIDALKEKLRTAESAAREEKLSCGHPVGCLDSTGPKTKTTCFWCVDVENWKEAEAQTLKVREVLLTARAAILFMHGNQPRTTLGGLPLEATLEIDRILALTYLGATGKSLLAAAREAALEEAARIADQGIQELERHAREICAGYEHGSASEATARADDRRWIAAAIRKLKEEKA